MAAAKISEAEAERLKQQKEFDIVVSERDILGTQLIRRNDELALLYEKLKIQMSTLRKGEAQYAARVPREESGESLRVDDRLHVALHRADATLAHDDLCRKRRCV